MSDEVKNGKKPQAMKLLVPMELCRNMTEAGFENVPETYATLPIGSVVTIQSDAEVDHMLRDKVAALYVPKKIEPSKG